MRDGDTSVRDRATFAVGSLSDHDTPRIRAALAERLRDEDRAVANEAALGLARRRDARAIPYIAAAVESAEAEIEEAADEITSPDMLTELLKARDAAGDLRRIEDAHRALPGAALTRRSDRSWSGGLSARPPGHKPARLPDSAERGNDGCSRTESPPLRICQRQPFGGSFSTAGSCSSAPPVGAA